MTYSSPAADAIELAREFPTYVKPLSAMDTREAKTHAYGIYVTRIAAQSLFGLRQQRGSNEEIPIVIEWPQADVSFESMAKYYGQKTRNEARITNHIYDSGLIQREDTGSLLTLSLVRVDDGVPILRAYVLKEEVDIDTFLLAFSLTPSVLPTLLEGPSQAQPLSISEMAKLLTANGVFPSTVEISGAARDICRIPRVDVLANPDLALMRWTQTEYDLFRAVEREWAKPEDWQVIEEIDDFIRLANQYTNRRKSRAGRSLENQACAIFDAFRLSYAFQARTERRNRPDFLFPSQKAYDDLDFPTDALTVLGAKTTCKDRWRQVALEADRLKDDWKYLITLQPGVSVNQVRQMIAEQVRLVTPKENHRAFAAEVRGEIWSVLDFVTYVSDKEEWVREMGYTY